MTDNFKPAIAAALALATASPVLAQGAAAPLTRATVEAQIKANFARIDTNHDGVLTTAESQAAREVAISARFNATFDGLDTDKNGSISRAEFIAANRKAIAAATGGKGLEDRAFVAADTNKDGRVTLAEALAPALAEFNAADTNKDGSLTVAERQEAGKKAQRK